jgi:hypothetical protein
MRTPSKYVLVLCLLLLIPLGIHAYIGLFSRYLADDYCTASTLRNLGFFNSQADWYENWSGRFSFTFLINLTQLLGSGMTPFLTTMILLLWVFVLRHSLDRVFHTFGVSAHALWSLFLGAFVIYATIDSTPDIYQSLYWQTGAITYAIPLILFTYLWGWISSKAGQNPGEKIRTPPLLFSGVTAFIAGGFSETYVAMQTTALAIALLALFFSPTRKRKLHPSLLAAGLAGSIVAMIAILLAPGNTVRQSLMPTSPEILGLIGWSLRHGLAFAAKSAISTPITFAISVLLPAVLVIAVPWNGELPSSIGNHNFRNMMTITLSIPLVTYLLIVASVAPSVYATSAYPAERSLITAQYILTIGLAIFGFFVGSLLKSKVPILIRYTNVIRALGIVLLGIGVLISTQRATTIIPSARSFAEQWDQRDKELRIAHEQGQVEIRVPSLPHMGGLAEIGQDPDEWINRCVAGSYGLERVISIR